MKARIDPTEYLEIRGYLTVTDVAEFVALAASREPYVEIDGTQYVIATLEVDNNATALGGHGMMTVRACLVGHEFRAPRAGVASVSREQRLDVEVLKGEVE